MACSTFFQTCPTSSGLRRTLHTSVCFVICKPDLKDLTARWMDFWRVTASMKGSGGLLCLNGSCRCFQWGFDWVLSNGFHLKGIVKDYYTVYTNYAVFLFGVTMAVRYLCMCILLQGKGLVRTFWLLGEQR